MSASNVPSVSPGQRIVDLALHYLKAEGVRVIFGVPGGLIHPFFDAVELDEELRLVVARHEEGAAFMADGYARLSGKLAACAATSGPGSTNLITGVAVAFADSVPMLVITGQAAIDVLGKGAAQESGREDIDIVAMFAPITKYSAMVTSPESFAHHLRRALRLALSGRPAPVHLNVPVDMWGKEAKADWFAPNTYRQPTHPFDRQAVQEASRQLLSAHNPVILAGSGVGTAGASAHLLNLAEMLPARVATSPKGKGLFPEDHPLSLGVLGFAGHEEAKETILGTQVDVLLVIGASLNEVTTFNWDPRLRPAKALIQSDILADRIGRNYPVDIPLVGDAQTILVELLYHVHRLLREEVVPGSTWTEESHQRRYLDAPLRQSEIYPVTPQRWRVDLQEVLPPDAVIFSDIGGHMLFNLHHLQIRQGQRFFLNMGFGSMGHGTVAAIGAALARPDLPVFALVGDGCFTMNGMDLVTAVEQQVPVLWIVENNNMHGITWHGSRQVQGRAMTSVRNRRSLDIAALARAMGLPAWVVDRPGQIQDCVREAMATHGPALIEVRTDGNIPPPVGDRARSVSGFIRR